MPQIRDQAMMILLYLILILDPAGCYDLKSASVVDLVHDRYVTLLCRYLRWNYGNDAARRWLGGGVALVTLAKEAQHIMEQRLRMAAARDAVTGEAIEYAQGPHNNCCCATCYQSYKA